MADNFKLPGSSYEEIIKIIKAYSSGKEGQAQPLDAIAQASGIDRTIVSRNNGFLLQMQLLMEGAKKTPTSECFSLGRAYSLNIREEVQKIWTTIACWTNQPAALMRYFLHNIMQCCLHRRLKQDSGSIKKKCRMRP